MRRISIPLFIIAILLCTIILPSPGQSCNWSEGTLLDHLKGLFMFATSNMAELEDYPVYITEYWGWWDMWVLGFTLEDHATNPDVYLINFHIMRLNH